MIKQIAPKSIQKSPMMCTPTKVTTKILPPDVRVQEGITEGMDVSLIEVYQFYLANFILFILFYSSIYATAC